MSIPASLRTLPGQALPRIGWYGSEPLSLDRFDPPQLSPLDWQGTGTKPFPGGLWTSPLIATPSVVLGSCWSLNDKGSGLPVTEVIPAPDAIVVCVSHREELAAVVARWPDRRDDGSYQRDYRPLAPGTVFVPYKVNWPAMAEEVDAFYLTGDAFSGPVDQSLNFPYLRPHLWGWDVPTVLFLRPAFSDGRVFREPVVTP